MKQIVILSGKGGTGKTTVAGAFMKLACQSAFADCDVEAPNLHLLSNEREEIKRDDYHGYKKAVKYPEYCINCGICEDVCKFGAVRGGEVNPYRCEGCGACEYFCQAKKVAGIPAIRLEENISGHTMISRIYGGTLSHAELEIGGGASGKLVTEVRRNLYNNVKGEQLAILDGSPGIGCPVIASITGTDMVLAVTEPTLSGLHDLQRIVDTARRFGTLCAVIINRYDINTDMAKEIEEYCDSNNIFKAGNIPYDPLVIEAVNSGKSIAGYVNSPAASAIAAIWKNVCGLLQI